MRKIAFMAIAAILLASPAIFASSTQEVEVPSNMINSPQVCQFSLSTYVGTLNNSGCTKKFTVGLSCPQESDVNATVVVFIDDLHAASEVVKVPAGKTKSQEVTICVDNSYAGKSYRLVVQ